MHEDKAALGEVLANDLFGQDGPHRVSSEYTQLEFDLWKVYRGYMEISKSVDTLTDIAFYIGSYPYTQGPTSPARYLQFHAEAYVSEVYILRERMTTLAKVVKRQLRRLRSPSVNAAQLDQLVSVVESSLEPVVQTRRVHTHESRLSDPAIERLDTIALFLQFPETALQRAAREQEKTAQREAFRKWRRIVTENNRAIRRLRTTYEKLLHQAVFFKGSPFLRRAEA